MTHTHHPVGRRWLLTVPLIASYALADNTFAGFGKMLVGGMFIWMPFYLAYWLSDGFTKFYVAGGGRSLSAAGATDPFTGQPCTVIIDNDSGNIDGYIR